MARQHRGAAAAAAAHLLRLELTEMAAERPSGRPLQAVHPCPGVSILNFVMGTGVA
jgi:hypothetical protein